MWNTADELAFIDHLGTWGADRTTPLTVAQKLALLNGYREGAARRVIWGNLNQEEVEAHVKREIARLTALPPDSLL